VTSYDDCANYASTHRGRKVSPNVRQWAIGKSRYLRYNLNTWEYSFHTARSELIRFRPNGTVVRGKPNPNGCVLYDGPSRIDGGRIVVILTGLTDDSENSKTGAMLQTWIIRADRKPTTARRDGTDCSVCGDCPHRSGSCYVNLGQGPRAVYDCWSAGRGYADYDPSVHDANIAGRMLRLGSYGDPAAVPIESFEPILASVGNHTGYTHQWVKVVGLAYRDVCMASVDTEEQVDEAVSHGWRYFYATPPGHTKRKGEVNCPASVEAGQRTQCEDCTLCNGLARSKAPNVFINIHGSVIHKNIYYHRTAPALATS